jgi:hypothetical protein
MSRVADIVEEKYLERLPQLLLAAGLCVVSVILATLVYVSRAPRPDSPPIAMTASVVVFETADCGKCDDFRNLIGRRHTKSELNVKVPLRYYDVTDSQPPKRYKLSFGIGHAPTAVVFDVYGREVARVTGMPKSFDAFQAALMPAVRRADRDIADAQKSAR